MKGSRERILNQGLDLLTQTGFAGLTLGGLAQQTGLSKSGLFAHFGSKEEMQLSFLEKMLEVGAAVFVEPAMCRPPGIARLQAVVEGWLGWTEKAGLHGGCPVAAGLFELDDVEPSDPVRQQLLAMESRWRSFLVSLTKEAVAVGDLRDGLDVDQFVWEVCGIYLAHHVSYRFLRDTHATGRALQAFSALVDRSKPEKRPRRKTKVADSNPRE